MTLQIHSQSNGIALMLPTEMFAASYCVYSVQRPNEQAIFYMGVSLLKDVFNLVDAYKMNLWRSEIKQDQPIILRILATSDSYIDARNYHHELYKLYRPAANQRGRMGNRGLSITCIEGEYQGKTWINLTEAARQTGISQSALSNHINGRAGYETIRRMRFLRTYEIKQ